MSRHTLKTDVPCGPEDVGAEVELEIVFEYRPGRPAVLYLRNGDPVYPADPEEVEFISCKGPMEGDGYDKYRQDTYDTLAHSYLESDIGFAHAVNVAAEDAEEARDRAAEYNREENQ